MKEAQLVNDRNIALKLALGDRGVIESGKGEAQSGNKMTKYSGSEGEP